MSHCKTTTIIIMSKTNPEMKSGLEGQNEGQLETPTSTPPAMANAMVTINDIQW